MTAVLFGLTVSSIGHPVTSQVLSDLTVFEYVMGAVAIVLFASAGVILRRGAVRFTGRLLSIRNQVPGSVAYGTIVQPELRRVLAAVGGDRGLTENTVRVVRLGEYECSWWSGSTKAALEGTIRSSEKIGYTIVPATYRGRTVDALQAIVETPAGPLALAIILLDDRRNGLLARPLTGAALQSIVSRIAVSAE